MLERDMSETPLPGPTIVEAPGTPETRTNDPRARVIGAFNRTMDRITQDRDAIVSKVQTEGPDFLTDHDKMIVLATQYAEEGAKKLTGGNTRLNDDIAEDKFNVEVEDRTTSQRYIRKEGISVGGLIDYLDGEEKRLGVLGKQAMAERRYNDASGFSKEITKIWTDKLTLIGNSPHAYWSLMGDWRGDLPPDVKNAARSDSSGIVDYYNTNRVGTEAFLRSENPLIKELDGESQDENWIRAEQDILEDRRELEIPPKGAQKPTFEPAANSKTLAPAEATAEDLSEPAAAEAEIPPTRVTALGIPKPEEPDRIHILIPGDRASPEARPRPEIKKEDIGTDLAVRTESPDRSEADRGGRGTKNKLFGWLINPKKTDGEKTDEKPESVIVEGKVREIHEESDSVSERARKISKKLLSTKFAKDLKKRWLITLIPLILSSTPDNGPMSKSQFPESPSQNKPEINRPAPTPQFGEPFGPEIPGIKIANPGNLEGYWQSEFVKNRSPYFSKEANLTPEQAGRNFKDLLGVVENPNKKSPDEPPHFVAQETVGGAHPTPEQEENRRLYDESFEDFKHNIVGLNNITEGDGVTLKKDIDEVRYLKSPDDIIWQTLNRLRFQDFDNKLSRS